MAIDFEKYIKKAGDKPKQEVITPPTNLEDSVEPREQEKSEPKEVKQKPENPSTNKKIDLEKIAKNQIILHDEVEKLKKTSLRVRKPAVLALVLISSFLMSLFALVSVLS